MSGVFKAVGKVFKGVVKVIKKVALPALAIGAIVLTGGAAIGATNLSSTSGSNLDVYPFIVLAADAFSQIAVRGLSSLDPTFLPPGQKSKSDPHGQRGYAGTIWWKAVMIENNGWMAAGYVGSKNLPA